MYVCVNVSVCACMRRVGVGVYKFRKFTFYVQPIRFMFLSVKYLYIDP